MRTPRRTLFFLLPFVALVTMAAAGPPWISVEYPANPLDPETRGALVVVRTYHHAAPRGAAMRAHALGEVNGRRVDHPLQVRATSRDGVYAVRGELPGPGAWVVRVASGDGNRAATVLVALNERREILSVNVPHESVEGGRWMVPRAPTDAEIAEMFRVASAMDDAARSSRLAAGAGAALLLLLGVPAGVAAVRRGRGDR